MKISPMVKPFRFWSQKVLPLVYDDSLSYYEVLCKVRDKLNEVIEYVQTTFLAKADEVISSYYVDVTYDRTNETINLEVDHE